MNITIIILFIGIISVVGLAVYVTDRYYRNKRIALGLPPEEDSPEIPEECCGQHTVCERKSLWGRVSEEIVYYDDEELDELKGISADKYTEEQRAAFRDILYSMQGKDVAGWVHSLELRNIELPQELLDEVYLIIIENID